MQKILATFKANPTPATAKKVVDYIRKHPMVLCMMSPDDIAAHTQAQRMVEA